MYKISIIVPVFKVERYLRKCIDSLLAQTMREIEIILVDDGAPDRCPEICDEYARQDQRIKVIHQADSIYSIDIPLYHYWSHKGSASRRKQPEDERDAAKCFKADFCWNYLVVTGRSGEY